MTEMDVSAPNNVCQPPPKITKQFMEDQSLTGGVLGAVPSAAV